VCGGSFAIVQFLWSNFVGPELVDIAGGMVSILALGLFSRVWKPEDAGEFPDVAAPNSRQMVSPPSAIPSAALVRRAWMPWIFLSVAVTVWGLGSSKAFFNGGRQGFADYRAGRPARVSPILAPNWSVPGLHRLVFREYPVEPIAVDRARVDDPTYQRTRAEAARFTLNWASATGTAILVAAVATALYLRIPFRQFVAVAIATAIRMRIALLTISLMMSIGFVTRYGGSDATLGLAFTRTGWLYPFFAAFLGWLGVALTGSDTSSNVLFGSLQKITAQQLGFDPVLIVTANSTGGVMGKMIDAQSIVVATASTGQVGQEGKILRFVFWHSVALATIMATIVMLQAYVFPWMIPK
jgi:lactate permease